MRNRAMAATSSVAVTWIWLLIMSGAGALSIGGSPLPLDPALSNIAPEECLWYAGYAGQGEADPDSKNETEQLFAEPQVQAFAEEIQTQVLKAVRRASGPEREKRIAAEQAPKLLKALLTRPFAAYVEDVEPREPKEKGFDASAAFVLNAGDQRGDVKAAIEELLRLLPPDAPPLSTETIARIEWRRVATPAVAPTVRFGWKNEYFIIAVGEKTPGKLLERMDGSAPKWLTEIREEHPIERELSIGYLNVEGVLKRIRPLVEAENPEAWPAIEKLGLTEVRVLHGVAGYDDVACTSIGHIVTSGERRGLLSLLPYKPLEKSDLAVVPKDATVALAVSLNAGEVLDNALKIASQFDPRAQEQLDKALWEIENKLGVNVRDDILAALGDSWVVYLPGGDLMTSWLNAAAAVRVKDGDKLAQAVEKIVEAAKAEIARHGEGVAINESTIGERKIYSLQLPAPVWPSWSVGEDWFVFSLSPQTVRSVLERKAEDSLAEAPVVAEALGKGGVAAIAYQDTPQLVRSVYPWLRMGVQMASGELRKQGIEFDPLLLPSDEVVIKHLRPGVSTFSHASDGFHFKSRQSLPGGGNLAAAAPVGVALLLPAVQGARQAAQRSQELNHLKQFALGALNHESAKAVLPSDIYSEDGKPLLSWRVRVLPYMEQQQLYNQFDLDEPWDSPHNRALLEQMPEVFRSPSSPGETTKTRYLAFKGKDTLFPPGREIGLRDVTDGTSATLLFVQAAPDGAVEWTKPADIDFNPEKPFAGLESPQGVFLAVFCDGAARAISLGLDAEVMKALVTRADGEVIPALEP